MNESTAETYFHVEIKDWIEKRNLYFDAIVSNKSMATLPYLRSISDFSHKNQVYYSWCDILMPWCKDIWSEVSSNPDAIDILEKYPNRIEWTTFCKNTSPRAIKIMLENPEKIYWFTFSTNSAPEAVDYMIKNPEKIVWPSFSCNRSEKALEFLVNEYPDKIDWFSLCCNPTPKAIKILVEKSPPQIDWIHCIGFLQNPAAVDVLRTKIDILENHDVYTRFVLYQNKNPDIINLILQIPYEDISWTYVMLFHPKLYRLYKTSKNDTDTIVGNLHCISMEPAIIDLLEENPHKIYWEDLSKNPAIFNYVYDYEKIKKDRSELNGEITSRYAAKIWHPTRIEKYLEKHGLDIREVDLDDLDEFDLYDM